MPYTIHSGILYNASHISCNADATAEDKSTPNLSSPATLTYQLLNSFQGRSQKPDHNPYPRLFSPPPRPSTFPGTFCIFRYSCSRAFCMSKSACRSCRTRCFSASRSMSRSTPLCICCYHQPSGRHASGQNIQRDLPPAPNARSQ